MYHERIIWLVLILFPRKWSPGVKGPRAGHHGFIECLPELIHACGGKDHIFSSMIEKELPATKMKQVRPSVPQFKALSLCESGKLYQEFSNLRVLLSESDSPGFKFHVPFTDSDYEHKDITPVS